MNRSFFHTPCDTGSTAPIKRDAYSVFSGARRHEAPGGGGYRPANLP